ncbi:MAG TPA: maleylpyruvate isomerase family mycothiol-dependent enzyme [Acidimicrobiales bacterium]
MAYDWITDALEETWSSVERTLQGREEEVYALATPCPGWSVRDVLSHLFGFELMLRGVPVPTHDGEWPSHVKNPIGEFNEAWVDAYRDAPGVEVLEIFRRTARESVERLRALSEEDWDKVGWSPEGDRPYHRFMETRVLDSWIHLQDIRDALLEPSDDHGPGEEIVLNRFEGSLPFVLGKRVAAPEGTVVRINLSGRLARSILLAVTDGRAQTLESSAQTPDLELTTPVALFWRRAAGRISAEAFLGASATDVRGDRDLARRLAESLVVMI